MTLAASAAFSPDIIAAAPRYAQQEDTIRAENLMTLPGLSRDDIGRNCTLIAGALVGSPSDPYYSKDSTAVLRIDTRSFTPLGFVNTVAALADCARTLQRPTWRDFWQRYGELSLRRGEDRGFTSLMWHASDWGGDNVYRGNLRDVTDSFSGCVEKTKSLDYLTRHRDRYAALADSATYETVRMTEMGFRTHMVRVLRPETLAGKEVAEGLRDGDIIIFNPRADGSDIYTVGFVVKRPDGPHLIHLSPDTGKVVEEKDTLYRYAKLKSKLINGYRLLRLE